MPLLSEHEFNRTIRELSRDYRRHFIVHKDGLEFGSHWSDLRLAAVLLCRTCFWGAGKQRRAGLTVTYPPAVLKVAERRIDPVSGQGGCVFYVGGNPEYLIMLLQYFDQCLLYVDPGDWPVQRDRLVGEVVETREKARRMKEGLKVAAH